MMIGLIVKNYTSKTLKCVCVCERRILHGGSGGGIIVGDKINLKKKQKRNYNGYYYYTRDLN